MVYTKRWKHYTLHLSICSQIMDSVVAIMVMVLEGPGVKPRC